MPTKKKQVKELPKEGELLPTSYPEVINKLTPNDNNTVQPVALMRLGLFVPTLKSTGNSKKNTSLGVDATGELARLQFARAEGYTNVRIVGPRLDMDTDFKTWLGIVRAFHKCKGNNIKLRFTEFARLCGINPKRMDAALRDRFADSLLRLTATTFSFSDPSGDKAYNTHLVERSFYDKPNDTVELRRDPSLMELYNVDHTVLLHLKVLRELPRRESAQALYTFFESLPADPIPVSFKRMRDRLSLTSEVKTQNQIIRRALSHLEEVGYLEFTEFKRGKIPMISIHSRKPKLGTVIIETEEEEQE